jgi:hypothetical protein
MYWNSIKIERFWVKWPLAKYSQNDPSLGQVCVTLKPKPLDRLSTPGTSVEGVSLAICPLIYYMTQVATKLKHINYVQCFNKLWALMSCLYLRCFVFIFFMNGCSWVCWVLTIHIDRRNDKCSKQVSIWSRVLECCTVSLLFPEDCFVEIFCFYKHCPNPGYLTYRVCTPL